MPEDRSAALHAIKENFRFLVLKVAKQVADTRQAVEHPGDAVPDAISARDDYVDNLKSIIDNRCFRLLADERLDKRTLDLVRAVGVCTSNLERIGDFAVNTVGQLRYLTDKGVPAEYGPAPFFDEIRGALEVVDDALLRRDMNLALRICRSEYAVDELYAQVFRRIMDGLRAGRRPEDLVTTLFIYRYLERMADALLNIGEAVIFAAIGEKLRVSEYRALEETLGQARMPMAEVAYQGIWETRSGCRIGTIHDRADTGPDARWVVFKEGHWKKVLEEKEALERWERLWPGVAPRVHGFQRHDDAASLLLEYLWGETLQQVILQRSDAHLERALGLLTGLFEPLWTQTREATPAKPRFLRQLEERLAEVLEVHPRFRFPRARIGAADAPSLDDLLRRARPLDEALECPFTVLTHGDCNLDNIIVAPERVHFIDLHRSSPGDYAQDISVLVASAFRLPILAGAARRRLDRASLVLFRFARAFARRHDDRTFQARLCLGLVRSFITSTRFELDEKLSRALLRRAVYLLERALGHEGDWASFTVPEEALVS